MRNFVAGLVLKVQLYVSRQVIKDLVAVSGGTEELSQKLTSMKVSAESGKRKGEERLAKARAEMTSAEGEIKLAEAELDQVRRLGGVLTL